MPRMMKHLLSTCQDGHFSDCVSRQGYNELLYECRCWCHNLAEDIDRIGAPRRDWHFVIAVAALVFCGLIFVWLVGTAFTS